MNNGGTYEVTANKVIDLSGTVTDTQYPSALVVKTALGGKQDTIDSSHKLDVANVATTNYASSDLESAVASRITGARDSTAVSATAHQVMTGVSMTDGVFTVTSADPLSVTDYTEVAGNDANGQYVLTKYVNGNSTTYKWELITRDGTETLQNPNGTN